jgi:hypothetical protein
LYERRGNAIENDDPADVGLPTKYQCLHPERVIVVDDTGENTNQAKNGNRGRQRLITALHGKAREWRSTNDYKFTVLPFTMATGEPIMCDVSVAKNRPLAMEERIGTNAMVQLY